MVKFKQDYYVNLTDDYGFRFRKGYSYMSRKVKGVVEVMSIDGKVRIKMDRDKIKRYLEE